MEGGTTMLTDKEVEQLIWEKASNIADQLNLEIFDIEIKGSQKNKILEITIDNPSDYVSINDCERFSKTIDPWLDEIQPFPNSYELVVSSPGLNRKLRGRNDYLRFKGKLAKFVLKNKEKKKTVLVGYIGNVSEESLEITEKETGNLFTIDLKDINKANLEIELQKNEKSGGAQK